MCGEIKMWDLSMYSERTCLWEESGRTLSYEQVKLFGEKFIKVVEDRCLVFVLCSN